MLKGRDKKRRILPRRPYSYRGPNRAIVNCRGLLVSAAILLCCVISTFAAQSQNVTSSAPAKAVSLASLSGTTLAPLWGGAVKLSVGITQQTTKGVPLHHFDISCQTCHQSSGGPGKNNSSTQQFRVSINRTCTTSDCHEYDRTLNHPVGISAAGAAPADMPMDSFGRITCLTCHEQKNSSVVSQDSGENNERTLRTSEGTEFCDSCHDNMTGGMTQQAHWQFSTRAHLGKINVNSNKTDTELFVGNIDSESNTCLTCHHEVSVTIPLLNETSAQKKARRRNMKDHPIGMDYSQVAMKKTMDFRFRYSPDSRSGVRLFDGKVGCGSCHSLYSEHEDYLVQTNERSALCNQCHEG